MRNAITIATTVVLSLWLSSSASKLCYESSPTIEIILPPAEDVIWPSRYAERYSIDSGLAETIVGNALKHNIPVDIAFALVATESSFRSGAVSNKGAIGLTQILPSTARGLDPTITREKLFDVDTNLDLGFQYLREMLDRYGNLPEALAAYNMGPTRVSRLVADGYNGTYRYAERVERNGY
jgi:soluble lytic murein transglycosylase-like protein